jgi:pyruvate kinase
MSNSTPLRKTKIIATMGPACDSPEILAAMIASGLNVVRLNLSHGSFDEHSLRVQRIREVADSVNAHIGVMADTKGIEVRTGRLRAGPVQLQPGQHFSLYTDSRLGDEHGVAVSYQYLAAEVQPNTTILLDDAAIEMTVTEVKATEIICKVVHGGLLGERKGVNLPEVQLAISAVSPDFLKNLEAEIDFAVSNEVDYLAASFVQSGEEVELIRQLITARGSTIPIIAKIENRAGVANLESIVKAADGIMVARGDLGVELPLAEVPSTQKKLIRATVSQGKPVITATQMLATMETNPKPTRAEASDVANAILDGTSAVMLSGETAVGKYPLQAIQTMAAIAIRAEASLSEYGYLQTISLATTNKVAEAVGQAAARLAEQLKASAIITLTDSGFTARLISKHRPECSIIAVTDSKTVALRLAMNWGVVPLLCDPKTAATDDARTAFACAKAVELGYLNFEDTVVVTHGTRAGVEGTDMIRVVSVG